MKSLEQALCRIIILLQLKIQILNKYYIILKQIITWNLAEKLRLFLMKVKLIYMTKHTPFLLKTCSFLCNTTLACFLLHNDSFFSFYISFSFFVACSSSTSREKIWCHSKVHCRSLFFMLWSLFFPWSVSPTTPLASTHSYMVITIKYVQYLLLSSPY